MTNNIATYWPIRSITRVQYYQLTWYNSLDSEDDYCTGCWNVSHCQQQQSYSGLCSPGQSNSTYFWNDSWVQTFHKGKMLWSLNKFSPQFFWCLRNEHRISRLMMFTTQIWVVLHFMGKPVVASQMFCQAIRRSVWRICAWWRLLLLRLEFNMFFLSNLSLVIPRRFYTPNALEAKSWRLLVVAENDTIVKIALLKETWNVFNIAVWKENGNNSWFLAKISYNKWRKCLRMLRIIGLGPYCEWSFSSMWGGGLSPEFPPPNTGNSRLK